VGGVEPIGDIRRKEASHFKKGPDKAGKNHQAMRVKISGPQAKKRGVKGLPSDGNAVDRLRPSDLGECDECSGEGSKGTGWNGTTHSFAKICCPEDGGECLEAKKKRCGRQVKIRTEAAQKGDRIEGRLIMETGQSGLSASREKRGEKAREQAETKTVDPKPNDAQWEYFKRAHGAKNQPGLLTIGEVNGDAIRRGKRPSARSNKGTICKRVGDAGNIQPWFLWMGKVSLDKLGYRTRGRDDTKPGKDSRYEETSGETK